MVRVEATSEAVEALELGYLNRELSRLDFNERVLALAEDESLPLLERVKFLAIVSQDVDEFFQIRVAGLKEQEAAGLATTSPDGLSPREQLAAIRSGIDALSARAAAVFAVLRPRLASAGIRIVDWSELKAGHRKELREVFETRIFPVLTPLSVDPAHPFPYISNLSLNLAVVARDPETRQQRFARVKVPPLLPRFLKLFGSRRFIPIEQVIAAHLGQLFPGMRIEAWYVFRVTRDTDIEIEIDEAEDLLSGLRTELLRRKRSPEAVRLEVDPSMTREVRSLLQRELQLKGSDVYVVDGLLDLGDLWSLTELKRPTLKVEPWIGVTQPRLAALRGAPPTSSPSCARATSSFSTPMTRSRPRSSSSCGGRPRTRTFWRSSRRSTERPMKRATTSCASWAQSGADDRQSRPARSRAWEATLRR